MANYDDKNLATYSEDEIDSNLDKVKTVDDFSSFMCYLAHAYNNRDNNDLEWKSTVDVLGDMGLEAFSIVGLVKNVDGLEMPGPTDWRWVGEIMLRGLLR